MQLQALLDHNDFMAALDAYVREQFPIPEGTTPSIDITAGRGEKGYSAVVSYASGGDTQKSTSASEAALSASLKVQGNSMNRVGEEIDLTKQVKKAEQAPEPEKKEPESKPEPEPVEEPKPQAMSGASMEAQQTADSIFDKEEDDVSEPEKENSGPKPLFSFPSKS